MKKNHRSINQMLARAKKIETKRELAIEWANGWEDEMMGLIHQLERAITNDDYDQLCIATGQIKAVTKKRFFALPGVLINLSSAGGEITK